MAGPARTALVALLSPTAWSEAMMGRDNRVLAAGLPLIFLACLLPLAATPIFPFIDYYNHIGRYFVLARLDEIAVFQDYYTPAWALLPNLGLDVIGVALMEVLPPFFVAGLLIVFLFALQFSGVVFLNRALHGRLSLWTAFPAAILLYSYILHWGFVNFLFGFSLGLWALGLWLTLEARPRLAIALSCLLGLGIFFVHAFAFALYGLALFGLELGRWWQSERGDLRRLARRVSGISLQAIVPAILFLNTPTAGAEGGFTQSDENLQTHLEAGTLGERIGWEIARRAEATLRVAESPSLILDIVTFVLGAALIVFLLRRGWARLHPIVIPPLLLLGGLYLVLPPNLFGVGYVPDRIPLVMALLGVAGLSVAPPTLKRARLLLAGLVALIFIRLALTGLGWQAQGEVYAGYLEATRAMAAGQIVTTIQVVDDNGRNSMTPRCHMLDAISLAQNRTISDLFAFAGQQPLALKPGFRTTLAKLPKRPGFIGGDIGAYYTDWLAATKDTDIAYVVVCGAPRLEVPPAVHLKPVFTTGPVTIFENTRRTASVH